ncbi:hypothetical protein, partial [Mesorhizobium sp. M7A.F.Ca.CA.001.05.1.1]
GMSMAITASTEGTLMAFQLAHRFRMINKKGNYVTDKPGSYWRWLSGKICLRLALADNLCLPTVPTMRGGKHGTALPGSSRDAVL